MTEPFTKAEAQHIARGLIARGAYRFSVTHAEPAMTSDEITHKEVLNAIDLGKAHKAALQADGTTATSSHVATSARRSRSSSRVRRRRCS